MYVMCINVCVCGKCEWGVPATKKKVCIEVLQNRLFKHLFNSNVSVTDRLVSYEY